MFISIEVNTTFFQNNTLFSLSNFSLTLVCLFPTSFNGLFSLFMGYSYSLWLASDVKSLESLVSRIFTLITLKNCMQVATCSNLNALLLMLQGRSATFQINDSQAFWERLIKTGFWDAKLDRAVRVLSIIITSTTIKRPCCSQCLNCNTFFLIVL